MSKINNAVEWAVGIANDDSHGYDQEFRWGPDYDCSALVISAWEQAGVKVKTAGASNTRDMKQVFLSNGFEDVISQVTVSSGKGLKRGDVILGNGHVAMVVADDGATIVHASQNEFGGVTGGQTGDQTGKEIYTLAYYNHPWISVLRYTAEGTGGDVEVQKINMKINGEMAEVDAITKEGNNYVKLQDLNSTTLGISYNEMPIISINSNQIEVKINGEATQVSAINVEGNNYIKLQDLNGAVIKIGYDGVPTIDTNSGGNNYIKNYGNLTDWRWVYDLVWSNSITNKAGKLLPPEEYPRNVYIYTDGSSYYAAFFNYLYDKEDDYNKVVSSGTFWNYDRSITCRQYKIDIVNKTISENSSSVNRSFNFAGYTHVNTNSQELFDYVRYNYTSKCNMSDVGWFSNWGGLPITKGDIYYMGNEFDSITGGYILDKKQDWNIPSSLEKNSDHMLLSVTNTSSSCITMGTKEKVLLNAGDIVSIEFEVLPGYSLWNLNLRLSTNYNLSTSIGGNMKSNVTSGYCTVNVTTSGYYYLLIDMGGSGSNGLLSQVKIKRLSVLKPTT